MKIEVIIPVIRPNLILNLLDTIKNNTILPNGVFLIDNIPDRCLFDLVKDYMDHIPNLGVGRPHRTMSVNQSWCWGFDVLDTADVYTVLNDDILLNKYFFEMLIETLQNSEIQIACPNTIIPHHIAGKVRRRGVPEDIQSTTPSPNRHSHLKCREGWAYSIRRPFLESIPPIPDSLVWFCGDDWLWHWSVQREVYWFLMRDNWIWHQVGGSLSEWDTKQRKALLEFEKKILMGILRSDYGYNGPYPSKERITIK